MSSSLQKLTSEYYSILGIDPAFSQQQQQRRFSTIVPTFSSRDSNYYDGETDEDEGFYGSYNESISSIGGEILGAGEHNTRGSYMTTNYYTSNNNYDSATSSSESNSAVYSVGSTSSWFLVIVLSSIIIITIVGNILVCLAVILVRKLRKPQNYLLVSLATSDLFVALFVMPFATIAEFHENRWPLNPALCDLWVSGKQSKAKSTLMSSFTLTSHNFSINL